MISQAVLLLTNIAHAPSVAGRIAVPAAPPMRKMTFEEADVAANA
jgi:hypothetical protein